MEARRTIGSVMFSIATEKNNTVHFRHLIIPGSSQWIGDRNLTTRCNRFHIGSSVFKRPAKIKDLWVILLLWPIMKFTPISQRITYSNLWESNNVNSGGQCFVPQNNFPYSIGTWNDQKSSRSLRTSTRMYSATPYFPILRSPVKECNMERWSSEILGRKE